jgi:hypothetical protein
MKKQIQSIWTLGALTALLTFGVALNAQQSPPTSTDPSSNQQSTAPQSQPSQPTDPTAQRPATEAPPAQASPSQAPTQGGQATPDSSTSATSGADTQTFSGTITKSGDKYVLQDADSGKSYDIDHQAQLKQYEGKKVRVHGTLDANNTIHVQ